MKFEVIHSDTQVSELLFQTHARLDLKLVYLHCRYCKIKWAKTFLFMHIRFFIHRWDLHPPKFKKIEVRHITYSFGDGHFRFLNVFSTSYHQSILFLSLTLVGFFTLISRTIWREVTFSHYNAIAFEDNSDRNKWEYKFLSQLYFERYSFYQENIMISLNLIF